MPYRDGTGDVLEAPTAEGVLRAEFAPRHVRLAVGRRSLDVTDRFATLVEYGRKRTERKRRSVQIAGRLIVARDVPRDGIGVWIEVEPDAPRAGIRRIFGVEPASLLEPTGLASLAALDHLAQRVHHELAYLAHGVRSAFEIGSAASGGLDKVLVVDCADRYVMYVRTLFRDRARFAMAAHGDGRIVLAPAKTREITVQSRHGVTVIGNYIRFADPHGLDLAKVPIPWITPEERDELARRIGHLVDRDLCLGRRN